MALRHSMEGTNIPKIADELASHQDTSKWKSIASVFMSFSSPVCGAIAHPSITSNDKRSLERSTMFASHGRSNEPPTAAKVPAGAPTWVTPELIEHTLRVWQPYYEHPLIPEDALEMIMGVSRMLDVVSSGGRHETVRCPGPGQQP